MGPWYFAELECPLRWKNHECIMVHFDTSGKIHHCEENLIRSVFGIVYAHFGKIVNISSVVAEHIHGNPLNTHNQINSYFPTDYMDSEFCVKMWVASACVRHLGN